MPIPPVVLPSPPVLCWIVPPVQSAVFGATRVAAVPTAFGVTLPPQTPLELPVTVRPPLLPVLSKLMPTPAVPEAVPALTAWKLRPLAPIVVFATLSAVALLVDRVLLAPVAVTVPPPVAVKAGSEPVLSVSAPVKAIVEPVLLVSETPTPEVTFIVPPYVNDAPLTLLATVKAVPLPLAL